MVSSIVSRLGKAPEEGIKAPCVVESTVNLVLTGLQTVNTVALAQNDRVLVKDQTDPAENGIWIASTAGWERASDFNQDDDVFNGVLVISAHSRVVYSIAFTGFWDAGVTAINFNQAMFDPLTSVITTAGGQTIGGALTVTGAFTSPGIADSATGQRVQIGDGLLTLGDATNGYNIVHPADNRGLALNGGNAAATGGSITVNGSTHPTTPGDVRLASSGNTFLNWDESVGDLEILTGVGAKTSALTIDASQSAVFAANLSSLGMTVTASDIRLAVGTTSTQFGGVGASPYTIEHNLTNQRLDIFGGNHPSAAAIFLSGHTHASTASDISFRSSSADCGSWDESAGEWSFHGTSGGSKPIVLKINSVGVDVAGRISTSGTALVAGDISLSAGWGTTATVTAVSGNDQRCTFTVNSLGTGQGSNPSINLTYTDGAWSVAPFVIVQRTGGATTAAEINVSTTTTVLTITWIGTPVASSSYTFTVIAIG